MSTGVHDRSPVLPALVLVAAWVALAASLWLGWTPLSIVLGLPLAVVVPGRLVVAVLARDADPLERWALAVGASLAVLVGCVAVASALPNGISPATLGGSLATATALLGALALRAPEAGVRPRPPVARALRQRPAWVLTGLVVSGCVAGALIVSVVTERDSFAEPLTQLSLSPGGGGLQLEVHNLEGGPTTYQLVTELPGAPTSTRSLTLADGRSYTRVLRPTASGTVVVRLYGGSATPSGYRQVTAAAP